MTANQPVNADDLIEKEIERYLDWIAALEAKACDKRVIKNASEWFHGDILSAYTRSSNTMTSLMGIRTIVFSNIEVKEAYRGKGLLHQLLNRLQQEAGRFTSTHIMFESVINPDLVKYLEKVGFKSTSGQDPQTPHMTRELVFEKTPKISP